MNRTDKFHWFATAVQAKNAAALFAVHNGSVVRHDGAGFIVLTNNERHFFHG